MQRIGIYPAFGGVGGAARRRVRVRRAFSLMEAIVVVMILAIMATVVVPRLNAMVQRPARQSAILVGDFLTSVAQRDALTSQPLAIEFNGEQNTLSLLVPGDEPGQWRRDLVIRPIQLGEAYLVEASADGAMLDTSQFRVEFRVGSPRPLIEMAISDDRDSRNEGPFQVRLSPGSPRAVVEGVSAQSTAEGEDLDAAGKGEQPW